MREPGSGTRATGSGRLGPDSMPHGSPLRSGGRVCEHGGMRALWTVVGALSLPAVLPAQEAAPAAAAAEPQLRVPRGLTGPVPGAPGFRPAVAALGRTLFADPILSVDHKTSCASCHRPDHGFASPEPRPAGSLGRRSLRHAPTLFNRAWGKAFSWDGKAQTLERQVLLPISDPNEMALPLRDAVERVRRSPGYGPRFQALFGRAPAADDLATALASYLRTVVHGDTVVDQFRAAQGSHLTTAERAGLWIFESKGRCWRCHGGANFTDEAFHNTGVGVEAGVPRPGRMAITRRDADLGRFKTPTLRGLALTPPYMHDGSIPTLRGVVDFYRRGGNPNRNLDPVLQPVSLTDAEADNLVAFLRALSRPAVAGGARK